MGVIRKIKDKDLIGGVCDTVIYPVTSTSAVCSLDAEGNPIEGVEPVLEDRLQDIEGDLEELKNNSGGSSSGGDIDLSSLSATAEAEETTAVSASVKVANKVLAFSFGIPRGKDGKDGTDGKDGVDGKDGKDGASGSADRTVFIYQRAAEQPTTPTGGSWDTSTNAINLPSGGWVLTYEDEGDDPLWMSTNTFSYVNGQPLYSWSTPVRLTGEDGKAGADSTKFEFIYILTENDTVKPDKPKSENTDDYIPTGWSDHPNGIDEEHQAEWVCTRSKVENDDGTTTWSEFTSPVLWSRWAVDGRDGDGVEYIYQRTTTAEAPNVPTVDVDSEEYQKDDYVPTGWTDNPTGVDSEYCWEWICTRKYDHTTGKWGAFIGSAADSSKAALWAKYGKDGAAGEGTAYRTIFAFCDSATKPETPTGGSWDSETNEITYPDGWYESIDSPTHYLWMSSAVFSPTGIVGTWTVPVRVGNADNGDNATMSSFSLTQSNPMIVLVKTDDVITGNKTNTISVSRAKTDSNGQITLSSATIQSITLTNASVGTGITASVSGNVITFAVDSTAAVGSSTLNFQVTVLYDEDNTITQTLYGSTSVAIISGTATTDASGDQYVIGVSPTNLNIPYKTTSSTTKYEADLDDAMSYIIVYKGTEVQAISASNVSITNNNACTTNLVTTAGSTYSGYIEIASVANKTVTGGGYDSSGNVVDITIPEDTGGYDVTITVGSLSYSAHVTFTTNSASYYKSEIDNAIKYQKTYGATKSEVEDLTQTLTNNYSTTTQTAEQISSQVSAMKTTIDTETNQKLESYATTSYVDQKADSITSTVEAVKITADEASTAATKAQQTADGFSASINSATTKANSAIEKANTLETTVNGYSSRISAAETNASSAKTAVNNMETTVSGITTRLTNVETAVDGTVTSDDFATYQNTVSGQFTTIGNRLTSAETSIKTNASGIEACVKKDTEYTGVTITEDGVKINSSAGSSINFNDNFTVDSSGNVVANSVSTTLVSKSGTSSITESDLAYKFKDSSGNVVAGFFTTGSGCQLAMKNPDDGSWYVVNFQKWQQWGKTVVAAAFTKYTTYKFGSAYYKTVSDTISNTIGQASVTSGNTLYEYAANDNGNSTYNGRMYTSNGLTSDYIPSGTGATGIYQFSQVMTNPGQTHTYGSDSTSISGTDYTVNLRYYFNGELKMTVAGLIFIPTSAHVGCTFGWTDNFAITIGSVTYNADISDGTDLAAVSSSITWQQLINNPTSYGLTSGISQ